MKYDRVIEILDRLTDLSTEVPISYRFDDLEDGELDEFYDIITKAVDLYAPTLDNNRGGEM